MGLRDKKKEFVEKVLDVDASMQGSLVFKDPVNLRINGKFDGTLEVKGSLTIGDTAIVNARIIGDSVVIAGRVKGNILAKEKLILLNTALVEGEIHPAKLTVAEGAIFQGECKMLQDFLNVEELAKYLEVDMNSILDWANSGKVPCSKAGENWTFERKAIDEWVTLGKIH